MMIIPIPSSVPELVALLVSVVITAVTLRLLELEIESGGVKLAMVLGGIITFVISILAGLGFSGFFIVFAVFECLCLTMYKIIFLR